MKRCYHRIVTAYDAWWFIYNHPKFMLRERYEITEKEAKDLRAGGFIVTQDRGHKSEYVQGMGNVGGASGKCWREWRHMHRHAIETNLSIFYAKVDAKGRTNDNPALNLHPECWLEFGSEEWGYYSDWENETSRMSYHDIALDCGGDTFDEALTVLAKLILKKYGDYKDRKGREGPHGRPVCADCMERGMLVSKMLRRKGHG